MTYKTKLENLQYLSNHVFQLDGDYKTILSYLLRKKQPGDGATLSEISQFTIKSENNPIKRGVVRKRLHGTGQHLGLLPTEYLQSLTRRKRYNKEEKALHLTLKGALASLSLGYPINKIHFFQNYFTHISEIVGNNKISNLITNYIIKEIHIFLLWHYINGIQLQGLINSKFYFFKFMKQPTLRSSFGLKSNTDIDKKIQNIFYEYLTLKGTLYFLGLKQIIPALDASYSQTDDFDKQLHSELVKDQIKARLDKIIYDWAFHIEYFNWHGNLNILRSASYYADLSLSDKIEINDKTIRRSVETYLKKFGVKIQITDDLNRELLIGF